MASINYAAREINVKIVYYGPGLSGKTTNLQVIHRKVPPEFKSDMVSLATETDRTLFFDFLPLDLGKIKGFSTKFQLYTVPGQVYYNATRKLVLRGVDGIVFVADSGQDKIEENIESFQNLEDNLAEYGYKRENIPTIIQYNKRDLPNALTVEEMHQHVNKYSLPWSEAVANKGVGVFDSLKLIGKIVIDYLNKKYSRGGNAARSAAAPAPSAQRPMQPLQPPVQPQMRPPAPQGFQGNQQFSPSNRVPPPPPPRPAPPPAMFNQQGGQPSANPMQQRMMSGNSAPAAPQQYPGYQQQMPQARQPITPPLQMPSPGRPPFNPMQQQPQQPYQQQPPQGYQPSAPVSPMQRPQQSQRPPMPAAPAMQSNFHEEESFEIAPPGMAPAAAQEEFYNYGSINLEPMDQQQMAPQQQEQYNPMYNQKSASSSDAVDFNVSGKTDLDLEIERYQREIEEKQRRSRGMPIQQPPQVQSGPPQQQQQQQQQPVYKQPAGQHEDYEVYNMEPASYNNNQMLQPPIQQNTLGADEDEMFFTSVDREHQKKPVKRPMNPRTAAQPPQQDKGFLSKFFKKDMP